MPYEAWPTYGGVEPGVIQTGIQTGSQTDPTYQVKTQPKNMYLLAGGVLIILFVFYKK